MDPRRQPELTKFKHFHKGRIVGVHFRVGSSGRAVTGRLCVMDVSKQGAYLNGRGPGFEFEGLDLYDEATGILHRADGPATDGILTIGMVRTNDTPDAAMLRLAQEDVPDVAALWSELQDAVRGKADAIDSSVRRGFSDGMRRLGADPDAVEFDDGGNRTFGGR